MKEKPFSFPGIKAGEESVIYVLLTQCVLLGIFFGAFDIKAHSLFLSIFDEKKLAWAYVFSGMAGIILLTIYTKLRNCLFFTYFSVINLAFITALTFIIWILLLVNPARWVIFLLFIMMGPLNILAMLGSRETINRFIGLTQKKRLLNLSDICLIIGIMLISFAIPVLLSLNLKPHNILLISAIAVLMATILQIAAIHKLKVVDGRDNTIIPHYDGIRIISKIFRDNSYIRLLLFFAALSVVVAFFVQYSFMAVAREQYPGEYDLARFIGFFTGSMMAFVLLVKIALFPWLLRNFGLQSCLALSPVMITGFTIIAVIVGTTMGFTPSASGFLIFFVLLALSRLFSRSLRDSVESPLLKVISTTFDEKTRNAIQSGMNGTINEIAVVSSGVLLSGLGFIASFKLLNFSIILIVICGFWIFTAFRVYSGYRKLIRQSFQSKNPPDAELQSQLLKPVRKVSFLADMTFDENYFDLVSGDSTCLERYPGSWFPSTILRHADESKDLSLLPIVKKIAADQGIEKQIRERAASISESLVLLSSLVTENEDGLRFSQKMLSDSRQPQTTRILRLLRENSDDSKKTGLMLIGKFRIKEMIPEVCAGLGLPKLKIHAENVLRHLVNSSAGQLQRYYMVSSGNQETGMTILRLLGEAKTNEDNMFLFSRLWSNSRQIKEVALSLLNANNFQSPDQEKENVHNLISDVIGIIVWNLSAKICLERNNDEEILPELNRDTARWYTFLFDLLSINYDSVEIARIKENLEKGTFESVNYALEMTGLIIGKPIKQKILLLLDDSPDIRKVKSLFQYYPGEIPEYPKLIDDILNRDYNLLGIWIRAVTLRKITSIKSDVMAQSAIALLFSPEPILREESARLIARSDQKIYNSVSDRIGKDMKDLIGMLRADKIPSKELLFEKVRFLSGTFQGVDEDDLLFPGNSLKYLKMIEVNALQAEGGFILWNLAGGTDPIVHSSEKENSVIKEMKSIEGFYLLSLNAIRDFHYRNPEKSAIILNYIGNNARVDNSPVKGFDK